MTDDSLQLKLFRPQAVIAAGRRWLGPIHVVSAPETLSIVVVAMIVLTLLLTASMTIEIPERIEAAGVLLPEGRILKIRAPRAGIVAALDVRDGDAVEAGTTLLAVSGQVLDTDSELARRRASLERELNLLQASAQEEAELATAGSRSLRMRLDIARARLEFAHAESEARRKQSALEKRRLQRVTSLSKQDLLPQQLADELASTAMQAEVMRLSAEQAWLRLNADVAQLEASLIEAEALPEQIEARADIRREALLRELSELRTRESIRVASPDRGIVAGTLIREGSSVTPGQLLMSVIEPGRELEAYIYVSADDAGRVSPGQGVELQMRAFPHQIYGTLEARVTSVSSVPLPAESLDTFVGLRGSVFEIRASLESTTIGRGNVRHTLPAGASFRADLIGRRWPLYRWLMRPASGEG